MRLTHINKQGRAQMVDITSKDATQREAIASGLIRMKEDTLQLILKEGIKKGDVLAVAQVAGIMAAKKTSEIIPMCHAIFITGCDIRFTFEDAVTLCITATVKTTGQTGVEMEALTAVSIAALTIYDMCKAIDKEMLISDICLVKKTGGQSGIFERTI